MVRDELWRGQRRASFAICVNSRNWRTRSPSGRSGNPAHPIETLRGIGPGACVNTIGLRDDERTGRQRNGIAYARPDAGKAETRFQYALQKSTAGNGHVIPRLRPEIKAVP